MMLSELTAEWRRQQLLLLQLLKEYDEFDWAPPPLRPSGCCLSSGIMMPSSSPPPPPAPPPATDGSSRQPSSSNHPVDASATSAAALQHAGPLPLEESLGLPRQLQLVPLSLVGGMDVSFSKADPSVACAALVVLEFPRLAVLRQHTCLLRMEQPYVPGFLAFREAPVFVQLIRQVRESHPQEMPQVILIDGNGVLHPQGLGLASHVGVLADVPTIGVAKNAFYLDGITEDKLRSLSQNHLHTAGDWAPLVGESGRTWGALLRGGGTSTDPIYVSSGHRVALLSAVAVVQRCLRFRVPEPTRQADICSRAFLRTNGASAPGP